MTAGTIVELNLAKGRFLVAIDGADHAVFTLHSHAVLTAGLQVDGELAAQGRMWLMPQTRQRFEAFGETGPMSLDDCRRELWA